MKINLLAVTKKRLSANLAFMFFALTIFASSIFFVPVAHAQSTPTTPPTTPAATAPAATKTATPAAPAGCAWNNPGACISAVAGSVGNAASGVVIGGVAMVAFAMASFCGWLLGFVGSFFNWIVVITVFQFGAYFGNSPGLLTSWGILRDIGNILLLFGFIFMGIIMILDLHTIDTRKAIPQLIIVAVLLNFSLFAAEAVIDVSNVLSAALYTQAGGGAQQCQTNEGSNDCATKQGISAMVLNSTGLNGIFNSIGSGGIGGVISEVAAHPIQQLIIWIGMTIFIVVTMVVLLAAAIMLVIRGVVLTFVMVLAPLGFAAMAIPPLAGLGKQWRDTLISQSFFAPIYLLLLLVSLKIMDAVKSSLNTKGGTLLQALSTPDTSLGGVVIVFALIIGFMIAALMTAKKMGAIGADFATSVATKTVRGTALAPVRAIGAPIYRNTVNRGAGFLSDLEKKPTFAGGVARQLNSLTAGGFQSGLKTVKDSKFLGDHSLQERKDFNKHESHTADIAKNKGILMKGLKPTATDDDKAAMERAIQKLPDADVVSLLNDLNPKDAEAAGAILSTGKFKKIIDNDKLDHHTKESLGKGRYAAPANALATLQEAIRTNDAAQIKAAADNMKEIIKNYSVKEYEMMADLEPAQLQATLAAVTEDGGSIVKDSTLDDLAKSEFIIPSQKTQVRAAMRTEKIKSMLSSATPLSAADTQKLVVHVQKSDAKKLAELSNTDLLRPEMVAGMSPEKLTAIMAKTGEFTQAQKEQFLNQIQDHYMNIPQNDPRYQTYEAMKRRVDANEATRNFWGRGLI